MGILLTTNSIVYENKMDKKMFLWIFIEWNFPELWYIHVHVHL